MGVHRRLRCNRHAFPDPFRLPGGHRRYSEADVPIRLCYLNNKLSLDEAEAETLRVEQVVPRWGLEIDEGVLPQELQLDDLAISFTKGCYLGQEIVSRIRSVGHVNRLLVKARTPGG